MAGKGRDLSGMARAPFGGITRNFECWKPIIAAINGYCLAGGLEIAICCDVRVAAEHAQFGVPEVSRAIIPGAGRTQRLPPMLPKGIALELLVTGARFDAQWALRYGLVNYVVPADKLLPKARELAQAICANGPLGGGAAKEDMARRLQTSVDEIEVVSVEPKEWPDACLGLGEENEVCAQVITPGFEVVLKVGESQFFYRTNQDGTHVRFADVSIEED